MRFENGASREEKNISDMCLCLSLISAGSVANAARIFLASQQGWENFFYIAPDLGPNMPKNGRDLVRKRGREKENEISNFAEENYERNLAYLKKTYFSKEYLNFVKKIENFQENLKFCQRNLKFSNEIIIFLKLHENF